MRTATCGVRLTSSTSIYIRGVVLFVETTTPVCLCWGSSKLTNRVIEKLLNWFSHLIP